MTESQIDTPIRALLVDDHAAVRIGLNYALSTLQDIVPVGQAADVQSALKQCADLRPDVVLMDLKMAARDDGIEATAAIKQRFPHIRVIVLTSFYDKDLVERAMRAGAVGYLLKDISMEELAQAIRRARAEKPALAPEAVQALLQSDAPGRDLSKRQRQILNLVARGLSNQEIAQQLNLALPTVRRHISIIFGKLKAANRAQAAALAVKYGLVKD